MDRRNGLIALLTALGLGASQTACSGAPVDIGENEISASSLESYVATWEGYIEEFERPGRSDRVVLKVFGENSGTIRFGETGASFELPTDPDSLPLQGHVPTTRTGGPGLRHLPDPGPFFQGFDYPLTRLIVESERLRVAFHPLAPYAEWCEWQTPVYRPEAADFHDSEWGCAPLNSVFDGTQCTVDGQVVDCVKIDACASTLYHSACACDQNACVFNPADAEMFRVDAALEDNGQKLVGSMNPRNNVRLSRVQ